MPVGAGIIKVFLEVCISSIVEAAKKVEGTCSSLVFLQYCNKDQEKLDPGYIETCITWWYVLSSSKHRSLDSPSPSSYLYASDRSAFLQLNVSPDPL